MFRQLRWVALFLLLFGACTNSPVADVEPTTTAPPVAVASDDGLLLFSMTLSNQSFEIPTVRLVVEIDGHSVVDEQFEVRGQHHFVGSVWRLEPGNHTVVVRAPGHNRELRQEVLLDGDTYAYASFWAPQEDPRGLIWDWSREPFAFG